MRSIFLTVLVVSCLTIVASASLRISEFLVDIEVLSTGELLITESLDVLFYTPHHGIYREIPVSYQRPTGENLTLDLNIADITLDAGLAPYTTKSSGRNLLIQIGDPDQTIVGAHTYTLEYTVNRALLFNSQEYIQLYWNVTGNDWQIPIDHAVTRVVLPESVSEAKVPTTSYVGYSGSTTRGRPAFRDTEGRYVFEATDLVPGEGLTIDVAIPREASGINAPSVGKRATYFLSANKYALLPILTLLMMLLWWWRRGKDPAKGVIAPRFDAPKDIRAGEAGVLIDDRADLQDVSAMVIDLAVKGFLSIREVGEEVKPPNDATKTSANGAPLDYEFTKLKDANGMLTDVERLVLDGIFNNAHPKTRSLSSMEHSFYKVLPSIKRALYARLIKKHYYTKDPEDVWASYALIGILILVVGAVLGVVLASLYLGIAVGICGVIAFAFSWIMPRKTQQGVDALREVLGLAEYIERAEVRRLEFHNAPEKSPREFEELLPYAIALNLTKIWTKQFEGLLERPPRWYSGSSETFNEHQFGVGMMRLASGMQRSFVSAPRTHRGSRGRSAWGGRSSFGGGSSGGGFGGGGGGGW
ncbi:DUF2207 domain-containing protein [Candidatus Bipolaricaulota bacterium]|nr:DUF2207 domain-containing protein [Candidatus Bipolaricaulota bacterium]